MNNISRDAFSIILENLQCKDIDNLKIINKQMFKDTTQLSMIYKKNNIKENWGEEIFKIIYNSTNLHIEENYNVFSDNQNMESIKNVIEMFYKEVIFNNYKLTTKIFIEVYSLYFSQSVMNNEKKKILFDHRKKCILKMINLDDINENNTSIKLLFGVSSYINRFHDILGRRITFNEFIIDLCN